MDNFDLLSRKRPPTHPGGIIKRMQLEPLGLSISEAAESLGVSRKTLSKIVNERGAVTSEMSLRLARAFGTSPELWLNLQKDYDLWHSFNDSDGWKKVKSIRAAEPKHNAGGGSGRG
jgi:antitoxin HigA-1